jgi:hypothetical protein
VAVDQRVAHLVQITVARPAKFTFMDAHGDHYRLVYALNRRSEGPIETQHSVLLQWANPR